MIACKHSQNNKRTGKKQFDWFSEWKQTRAAIGKFRKHAKQSKRIACSLTSLAFQHSNGQSNKPVSMLGIFLVGKQAKLANFVDDNKAATIYVESITTPHIEDGVNSLLF